MTLPLELTDLSASRGFAQGRDVRLELRYLLRVVSVGLEFGHGALLDRLRPLQSEILAREAGIAPRGEGRLALYLHWSASGRVSAMVRGQIAAWHGLGYDVVFISNADPPPEDWNAVAEWACLRLRRSNTGRDFGAWRDALAAISDSLPWHRELLLVNDSVLGPVRPLPPVVAALRDGGPGFFGLTESRGGGTHLQSYLLLASGAGATADLADFLARYRDHRSKWRVVQVGEIALTRFMQERGHRAAALFGLDRVVAHVDPTVFASLGERFVAADSTARLGMNLTHHLWRPLVEQFGFPYLKTELVRRNPGRLPGVERWPELVDPDMRALIRDHLAGH